MLDKILTWKSQLIPAINYLLQLDPNSAGKNDYHGPYYQCLNNCDQQRMWYMLYL